jgi:FkbM family methyltransferase
MKYVTEYSIIKKIVDKINQNKIAYLISYPVRLIIHVPHHFIFLLLKIAHPFDKAKIKGLALYAHLDYNKKKIKTNIEDTLTFYRATSACRKEPDTVRWIEEHLSDGDVYYDIGANVGAYSLVAASIFKKITVYSFEPSIFTFPVLCKNIYSNDMGNIVNPVCLVLFNKSGYYDFSYSGIGPGIAYNSAKIIKDVEYNCESITKIKQQFVTLDDFVKLDNVLFPNFIKLDVDGVEYEILQGGVGVLNDKRLKYIIVEIDETDKDIKSKIISIIEKNKFSLKEKDSRQEDSPIRNYLFIR